MGRGAARRAGGRRRKPSVPTAPSAPRRHPPAPVRRPGGPRPGVAGSAGSRTARPAPADDRRRTAGRRLHRAPRAGAGRRGRRADCPAARALAGLLPVDQPRQAPDPLLAPKRQECRSMTVCCASGCACAEPSRKPCQVSPLTRCNQARVSALYQPSSASRQRSPSTAPASTEANWSLSPSRIRRACGGSASSRLAIISGRSSRLIHHQHVQRQRVVPVVAEVPGIRTAAKQTVQE